MPPQQKGKGATLLGDSKGDRQAAAKLLDKALARPEPMPAADLIAALVYRAELAISLGDRPVATACLDRVRGMDASVAAADDLARAAELEQGIALEEPR